MSLVVRMFEKQNCVLTDLHENLCVFDSNKKNCFFYEFTNRHVHNRHLSSFGDFWSNLFDENDTLLARYQPNRQKNENDKKLTMEM